MAQYKVPQDVEADDKLLGPFSFRQFVYLLIAGGLIALAVALFQIFPVLAIIPVPFILFLGALALPLRKDQPMETYLAALVSFYLKPRTKRWEPGQRESTIMITAPKKTDDAPRTRDITGEEATHRLSFLADIVDTEGYAIKGDNSRKVNDDIVAEAQMTSDIFETSHFDDLENTINKDENDHHAKVVQEMREALDKLERVDGKATIIKKDSLKQETMSTVGGVPVQDAAPVAENLSVRPETKPETVADPNVNMGPNYASSAVVLPTPSTETKARPRVEIELPNNGGRVNGEKTGQITAKPSIIELANNSDYSVATISKEAKRIKERDEGEVFISLH